MRRYLLPKVVASTLLSANRICIAPPCSGSVHSGSQRRTECSVFPATPEIRSSRPSKDPGAFRMSQICTRLGPVVGTDCPRAVAQMPKRHSARRCATLFIWGRLLWELGVVREYGRLAQSEPSSATHVTDRARRYSLYADLWTPF